MKKNAKQKSESESLRELAEELHKKVKSKENSKLDEIDKLKLIHELEVHQIELELQNEELAQARAIEKNISEKYTELYDFAPAGYFTLTKDGEILELNLNGANLLGKDRSYLVNKRFNVFISDDSKNIFNQFLEKVFTSKVKESCEIVLQNQSDSIYVYLTGIVTEYHDQCFLTAMDITSRRQSEMVIKASEEKYSDLFNSIRDAILVADNERNIIDCNPAFNELFGYSEGEIIGKKTSYCYENEEQFLALGQAIKDNTDKNAPFLYTVNYKKKNKDVFPGETGVYFLKDENGKVNGFIGLIRDIAKRKRTENELIKSKEKAEESDRLKSAFLANMSHEIRTPMNGILGFVGLLKKPKVTGEKQQKYIDIIEKSGVRMLNILNDIMSISKVESGLMEMSISETNINEQIEYLYTFFKPEAELLGLQLSYKSELSENEANVKTDKEKIYAILTNLIKNALKFTNKGSIEFGYKLLGEGKQKVIEFYVKDTGLGISKEKQNFIFERFRQGCETLTRDHEGAGLGLSISKAYVEMLGGKIWVDSIEDKCSCFYFTIPYVLEDKKEIAKDIKNTDGLTNLNNLKILLVENDEVSIHLFVELIGISSNEILIARNGAEAIEFCQIHKDIDLILMDIQLPLMNGHDAVKQIRKFNKEVIIIAQTAFALSGDKGKAIDSGCNDYISKPIDMVLLDNLIGKYFKN